MCLLTPNVKLNTVTFDEQKAIQYLAYITMLSKNFHNSTFQNCYFQDTVSTPKPMVIRQYSPLLNTEPFYSLSDGQWDILFP